MSATASSRMPRPIVWPVQVPEPGMAGLGSSASNPGYCRVIRQISSHDFILLTDQLKVFYVTVKGARLRSRGVSTGSSSSTSCDEQRRRPWGRGSTPQKCRMV